MKQNQNVSHTSMCALDDVKQTVSNEFFAGLLIDTHCAILDDLCPDLSQFIRCYYGKHGIKATIAECKSLASNVLIHVNDGGYAESDWDDASALCFSGQGHMVLGVLTSKFGYTASRPDALKVILQSLRFPQRFAYPDEKLDGIPGVLEINDNHRRTHLDQVSYRSVERLTGKWIGVPDIIQDEDLRYYYADLIPMRYRAMVCKDVLIDPYHDNPLAQKVYYRAGVYYGQFMEQVPRYAELDFAPDFTKGSSFEGAKTLIDKIHVYAETEYTLLKDELYPLVGEHVGSDPVLIEQHATRARLVNVPKDSARSRVVAPEHVVVNFDATAWRMAIESTIRALIPEGMIPFWDQTVQEEQILEGTAMRTFIQKGFCSIDLSGASDSIPWWQIEYALKYLCDDSELMLTVFTTLRADFLTYKYGHGNVKSHICLTSGNPLTWINESIWFLCICLSAMVEQDLNEDEPAPQHITEAADKYAGEVSTYGDDILVKKEYFYSVAFALSLLGYKVNDTKSYDGYFGESCGCDSYRGHDVSSVYWPRRHLDFDFSPRASWKKGENALAVSSLIAMQHRLFDISPSAAKVLEEKVKDLAPGMTYHAPHTECMDLWGYYPSKLCLAPIAKVKGEVFNLAQSRTNADPSTISLDQARTRAKHYIISSKASGDSDASYADKANLDMYLYMSWLRARAHKYAPFWYDTDGGMPCWVWIDGVRCSSCIESYTDATLLRCQPETRYELHAE